MIAVNEIFLLNSEVPDSFDGRYFGVLPMGHCPGPHHPALHPNRPACTVRRTLMVGLSVLALTCAAHAAVETMVDHAIADALAAFRAPQT